MALQELELRYNNAPSRSAERGLYRCRKVKRIADRIRRLVPQNERSRQNRKKYNHYLKKLTRQAAPGTTISGWRVSGRSKSENAPELILGSFLRLWTKAVGKPDFHAEC
jgi:hypothetical protein